MAQRDQYFLGQSLTEQKRLREQAEELAQDANQLFDRINIAPRCRVVELGCGPRGCLDLLSRRVGPQGSVVACAGRMAEKLMGSGAVVEKETARCRALMTSMGLHTGRRGMNA